MADLKKLNELAHLEKDCPRCGGSSSGVRSGIEGRYPLDVACSLCGGTGKVFVFPEMVRVKCDHRGHGPTPRPWIKNCSDCGGRGTIASTDGMVWADAAAALGYPFNMRKEGDTWFAWYEDMWDKRGEAPDFRAAVITAIEAALEAMKQ